MKREKLAAVFFAAITMFGWAASAGAVDGTIEINQAKVLANGGFPFTINASNAGQSYRLTGPLTVPASTNGIVVNANNVTIDLNGFTITGPGTSSTGLGINASTEAHVTVENGTLTGLGFGVVTGNNGTIKSVHADANANNGIETGSSSMIQGCTANGNATGIETGAGSLISGDIVESNSSAGITADATTGYGGNELDNTTNVSGGTSMKNNVCTTGGITSTC